jgi:hypothetical protein
MSTPADQPASDSAVSRSPQIDNLLGALADQQPALWKYLVSVLSLRETATGSDPDVTSATNAIAEALNWSTNRPRVASGTFVIHGNVIDPTGAPVSGYRMQLSTASRVLDKIAPVAANSDGFVTVTLRTEEYPEIFKPDQPVLVRIIDNSGAEVYAPPKGVNAADGTMAVFTVVVPAAAKKQSTARGSALNQRKPATKTARTKPAP